MPQACGLAWPTVTTPQPGPFSVQRAILGPRVTGFCHVRIPGVCSVTQTQNPVREVLNQEPGVGSRNPNFCPNTPGDSDPPDTWTTS